MKGQGITHIYPWSVCHSLLSFFLVFISSVLVLILSSEILKYPSTHLFIFYNFLILLIFFNFHIIVLTRWWSSTLHYCLYFCSLIFLLLKFSYILCIVNVERRLYSIRAGYKWRNEKINFHFRFLIFSSSYTVFIRILCTHFHSIPMLKQKFQTVISFHFQWDLCFRAQHDSSS